MEGSNSSRPRRFTGNSAMFSSDRQQFSSMGTGSTPVPWNLMNFYSSEGPWHASNIIPVASSKGQSGQNLPESASLQTNGPAFQGYGNRQLASECDTMAEDSGYGGSGGSRAPYSIENTSVYEEDRNLDAQAAPHRSDALPLHADPSSESQLADWSQPRGPTSSTTAPPSNSEFRYCCTECARWTRTKADYNKHMLRHSKPFVCLVSDCPRRSEGFSTKNDLDRHKRSVHSDLSVSGPRFVCRLGKCAAKDPPKLWPRADNFRSHLSRCHHRKVSADEDLDAYIYRQPSSDVPLRQDLEGVGTAVSCLGTDPDSFQMPRPPALQFPQTFAGMQMNEPSGDGLELQDSLDSLLPDDPTSQDNNAPGLASVRQDSEDFIQPGVLCKTRQRHSQDTSSLQESLLSISARLPGQAPNQGDTFGDKQSLTDEGTTLERPDLISAKKLQNNVTAEGHRVDSDKSLPRDTSSQSESIDLSMADMDQQQDQSTDLSSFDPLADIVPRLDHGPDKLLEFLKSIPKEYLHRVLKSEYGDSQGDSSSQDSPSSGSSRDLRTCPDCPKTFSRPCELKKHMKRHEKPYGCTFRDCSKIFGSKSDWKRHESSQHGQMETWKCEDTKPNQQESCKKVFQRRESFKNHLQRDHMVCDPKQVEERLERCRTGRQCNTHFWCGFCKSTIELGTERVNAWTTRCNHIDDHFSGRIDNRKWYISEWKHSDDADETRKASPQKPESSAPKEAAAGSTTAKRKLSTDDDEENEANKRQRGDHDYMWICCKCNSEANIMTTSSCIECQHQKCSMNCEVQVLEFPVAADPFIVG